MDDLSWLATCLLLAVFVLFTIIYYLVSHIFLENDFRIHSNSLHCSERTVFEGEVSGGKNFLYIAKDSKVGRSLTVLFDRYKDLKSKLGLEDGGVPQRRTNQTTESSSTPTTPTSDEVSREIANVSLTAHSTSGNVHVQIAHKQQKAGRFSTSTDTTTSSTDNAPQDKHRPKKSPRGNAPGSSDTTGGNSTNSCSCCRSDTESSNRCCNKPGTKTCRTSSSDTPPKIKSVHKVSASTSTKTLEIQDTFYFDSESPNKSNRSDVPGKYSRNRGRQSLSDKNLRKLANKNSSHSIHKRHSRGSSSYSDLSEHQKSTSIIFRDKGSSQHLSIKMGNALPAYKVPPSENQNTKYRDTSSSHEVLNRSKYLQGSTPERKGGQHKYSSTPFPDCCEDLREILSTIKKDKVFNEIRADTSQTSRHKDLVRKRSSALRKYHSSKHHGSKTNSNGSRGSHFGSAKMIPDNLLANLKKECLSFCNENTTESSKRDRKKKSRKGSELSIRSTFSIRKTKHRPSKDKHDLYRTSELYSNESLLHSKSKKGSRSHDADKRQRRKEAQKYSEISEEEIDMSQDSEHSISSRNDKMKTKSSKYGTKTEKSKRSAKSKYPSSKSNKYLSPDESEISVLNIESKTVISRKGRPESATKEKSKHKRTKSSLEKFKDKLEQVSEESFDEYENKYSSRKHGQDKADKGKSNRHDLSDDHSSRDNLRNERYDERAGRKSSKQRSPKLSVSSRIDIKVEKERGRDSAKRKKKSFEESSFDAYKEPHISDSKHGGKHSYKRSFDKSTPDKYGNLPKKSYEERKSVTTSGPESSAKYNHYPEREQEVRVYEREDISPDISKTRLKVESRERTIESRGRYDKDGESGKRSRRQDIKVSSVYSLYGSGKYSPRVSELYVSSKTPIPNSSEKHHRSRRDKRDEDASHLYDSHEPSETNLDDHEYSKKSGKAKKNGKSRKKSSRLSAIENDSPSISELCVVSKTRIYKSKPHDKHRGSKEKDARSRKSGRGNSYDYDISPDRSEISMSQYSPTSKRDKEREKLSSRKRDDLSNRSVVSVKSYSMSNISIENIHKKSLASSAKKKRNLSAEREITQKPHDRFDKQGSEFSRDLRDKGYDKFTDSLDKPMLRRTSSKDHIQKTPSGSCCPVLYRTPPDCCPPAFNANIPSTSGYSSNRTRLGDYTLEHEFHASLEKDRARNKLNRSRESSGRERRRKEDGRYDRHLHNVPRRSYGSENVSQLSNLPSYRTSPTGSHRRQSSSRKPELKYHTLDTQTSFKRSDAATSALKLSATISTTGRRRGSRRSSSISISTKKSRRSKDASICCGSKDSWKKRSSLIKKRDEHSSREYENDYNFWKRKALDDARVQAELELLRNRDQDNRGVEEGSSCSICGRSQEQLPVVTEQPYSATKHEYRKRSIIATRTIHYATPVPESSLPRHFLASGSNVHLDITLSDTQSPLNIQIDSHPHDHNDQHTDEEVCEICKLPIKHTESNCPGKGPSSSRYEIGGTRMMKHNNKKQIPFGRDNLQLSVCEKCQGRFLKDYSTSAEQKDETEVALNSLNHEISCKGSLSRFQSDTSHFVSSGRRATQSEIFRNENKGLLHGLNQQVKQLIDQARLVACSMFKDSQNINKCIDKKASVTGKIELKYSPPSHVQNHKQMLARVSSNIRSNRINVSYENPSSTVQISLSRGHCNQYNDQDIKETTSNLCNRRSCASLPEFKKHSKTKYGYIDRKTSSLNKICQKRKLRNKIRNNTTNEKIKYYADPCNEETCPFLDSPTCSGTSHTIYKECVTCKDSLLNAIADIKALLNTSNSCNEKSNYQIPRSSNSRSNSSANNFCKRLPKRQESSSSCCQKFLDSIKKGNLKNKTMEYEIISPRFGGSTEPNKFVTTNKNICYGKTCKVLQTARALYYGYGDKDCDYQDIEERSGGSEEFENNRTKKHTDNQQRRTCPNIIKQNRCINSREKVPKANLIKLDRKSSNKLVRFAADDADSGFESRDPVYKSGSKYKDSGTYKASNTSSENGETSKPQIKTNHNYFIYTLSHITDMSGSLGKSYYFPKGQLESVNDLLATDETQVSQFGDNTLTPKTDQSNVNHLTVGELDEISRRLSKIRVFLRSRNEWKKKIPFRPRSKFLTRLLTYPKHRNSKTTEELMSNIDKKYSNYSTKAINENSSKNIKPSNNFVSNCVALKNKKSSSRGKHSLRRKTRKKRFYKNNISSSTDCFENVVSFESANAVNSSNYNFSNSSSWNSSTVIDDNMRPKNRYLRRPSKFSKIRPVFPKYYSVTFTNSGYEDLKKASRYRYMRLGSSTKPNKDINNWYSISRSTPPLKTIRSNNTSKSCSIKSKTFERPRVSLKYVYNCSQFFSNSTLDVKALQSKDAVQENVSFIGSQFIPVRTKKIYRAKLSTTNIHKTTDMYKYQLLQSSDIAKKATEYKDLYKISVKNNSPVWSGEYEDFYGTCPELGSSSENKLDGFTSSRTCTEITAGQSAPSLHANHCTQTGRSTLNFSFTTSVCTRKNPDSCSYEKHCDSDVTLTPTLRPSNIRNLITTCYGKDAEASGKLTLTSTKFVKVVKTTSKAKVSVQPRFGVKRTYYCSLRNNIPANVRRTLRAIHSKPESK